MMSYDVDERKSYIIGSVTMAKNHILTKALNHNWLGHNGKIAELMLLSARDSEIRSKLYDLFFFFFNLVGKDTTGKI